jgi:ATP-binding cassette, subfamily B, bacterial
VSEGVRIGDLALYRRIAAELRPYWPQIAGIVALNLASAPLSLLAPLPLKIVVDSVIGTVPLPSIIASLVPAWVSASSSARLGFAGFLLIVISLLTYVLILAVWVLKNYTGEKLTVWFRARLFHRAEQLSLEYHDRKTTTDSVYRIQNDAPALQSLALNGLVPMASSAVAIAAMIYVMTQIDISLAAVALFIVPVLYGLTTSCRKRLRTRWTEFKNVESGATSLVQEVLSALRTVKAFGREAAERDRFIARSTPLSRVKSILGSSREGLTS